MIATANLNISQKHKKYLSQIPDYDPIATAEDCWFDNEAADNALGFFKDHLVFIEGATANQPFALEPWQKAIVANLFGWKRPDGTRRYRTALVYVPRKNGKTPLLAGIVDYMGFCDYEPGAQLYSAANEKEQAALIYRHAAGMILRNKELQSRSKQYRSLKSIEFYDGTTFFRSLSSDDKNKHGYNSQLVVVDELHAMQKRDLVDVLTTSTASRRQPLFIYITTADYVRESICNETYDYACQVRDGVIIDKEFLPVVYEAGPDDDWREEKTWRKANPNFGVSVRADYISAMCKKAQVSPRLENTFKRLHLNVRTEQDVRWVSIDQWNSCDRTVLPGDMTGRRCYIGADLANNKDTSSLCLLFPLEDDYWFFMPKVYIPEDTAREKESEDKVPYSQWAKEGFVTLTPGNVIDFNYIRKDLESAFEMYDVRGVAFDKWQFEYLRQTLIGDGIDEDKLISFGQGFVSMSAPMKKFESLILSGKVIHNDNPILKWMVSNVAVEIDAAENIKPSKKKSIGRIDGVVTSIMSLGIAILNSGTQESLYETEGIRTVG